MSSGLRNCSSVRPWRKNHERCNDSKVLGLADQANIKEHERPAQKDNSLKKQPYRLSRSSSSKTLSVLTIATLQSFKMHFTNALAILTAFASSAVMAVPSNLGNSHNGVFARGGGGGDHSCKGDQWYVGWDKKCACPTGCEYDEAVGKCHYPTHPPLTCGYGELLWCARSATDYCQYGESSSPPFTSPQVTTDAHSCRCPPQT